MKEYIVPLTEEEAFYGFRHVATDLIRCKDCARNPRNNGGKRILCPCPMDRYMGDEGYCSKAELRGEE